MTERDVIREKARQACLQDDYATAYALYERLLRENPDDPEVLLDYGRAVYYEHDDLDKAAQLFHHALEVRPGWIEAILWLADVGATGYGPGYDGAVQLYRRAIELNPSCVDAYMGLGLQYQAPSVSLTLQQAMEAFRKAIQLAPQRADAYLDLGMLLLDAGDMRLASQELATAVNIFNTKDEQNRAQVVQKVIDQIDRHEPIKKRFRWNFSSRYNWPEYN